MARFFNKFKKPSFWVIFGPFIQFWGQNIFLENPAVMHNFIWVSSNMPNLEKTEQVEGQTQQQTDPSL